jgi:hypothetical protein
LKTKKKGKQKRQKLWTRQCFDFLPLSLTEIEHLTHALAQTTLTIQKLGHMPYAQAFNNKADILALRCFY